MDQIEVVRDFNRFYTQRLGVLHDHYLGQGRPLGEARLLFEIGAGADLRDLRGRLGLDSGYLSRLLRSLGDQGLVSVGPHPADRRVRVATLTEAGRRERADLESRSRDSVAALLEPLTEEQRARLIEAQERIRRLVRLAGVAIEAVADDDPDGRGCLTAYASELALRFPEGYDPATLTPPGTLGDGTFLLAREEGAPVGCGLWIPSGSFAEIRHLWVSPAARGYGLGARLLRSLEQDAAAHGVTRLRLGTHPALTEAIALYRAAGYREIPSYDTSPYNQLSFEKEVVL
ncbi:bifunctional helix-turn-helix transcriptional regulator/GNAT family N-acetyltransferase [Paractinoplanes brasiliensis]|uniref:MarR family transcriptional regulator with acetyltransferase activity n=1 Tax=Paractinoplanes brasiliensis TaxID=52695 RepID=A0A4V6PSU6_9ACTN|nr:helix-turn-helix domain-containing GNAT family N-acetyltransferase [Actinoplanes brasiliensis]TDO37728.1 MarR family transcriptional regulator with acetyltransferase activity [Actinoplanes brasiliensis]GID32067.1 PadR family transcriptional regulator [Actinoplanes brasiliensis]